MDDETRDNALGADAPSDEREVTAAKEDVITDAPDLTEPTSPEDGTAPQGVDYAALAEEDLNALREEFAALRHIRSLSELENPQRYGELRDLGLSAREAYLATSTQRPSPASVYDNRSHLRSAVMRTHGASGEQMSAQQMREARELFGDLSDSEIVKLYKKVNS